jgi:hypothetical protein
VTRGDGPFALQMSPAACVPETTALLAELTLAFQRADRTSVAPTDRVRAARWPLAAANTNATLSTETRGLTISAPASATRVGYV